MLRRTLCVVSVLALLGASGCMFDPTDPLGRRNALHWSQKRYSQLIRWGQIEQASKYVDPEQREEFLEVARGFVDIHFTDYEIREIDVDGRDATVRVTYSGYLNSLPVEKQFDEIQHWHREGGTRWIVRTELAQLRAALNAWARP